MTRPAIEVDGLGKRYRIGRLKGQPVSVARSLRRGLARAFDRLRSGGADEHVWSLRDVSFSVGRGEVVGLIGRNGAGKSTLIKVLSRITDPTEGRALLHGRVGALLEVGTGFHPELSGRENVYLNGSILGMRRAEVRRKFDAIVAFAEVERFIDTPVKRYSSGMAVRLAFAVAAHLEAEILLIDEVLAVGDVAFQAKCLGKLGELAGEGRTALFVSHNMAAVASRCPEVLVLDSGRLVYRGPAAEGIRRYLATRGEGGTAGQVERLPPDEVFHLRGFSLEQEGSASEPFVTSRPVELRVDYDVLRPVHGLRVGFDLFDQATGQLVFRSFHDDAEPEPDTVGPGGYAATATIPANLLAAREYRAELLVGIFGLRMIVEEAVHRVFKVVNLDGLNAHYADARPGCLLPAIDWRRRREGG